MTYMEQLAKKIRKVASIIETIDFIPHSEARVAYCLLAKAHEDLTYLVHSTTPDAWLFGYGEVGDPVRNSKFSDDCP